jgi:hypothetical protein
MPQTMATAAKCDQVLGPVGPSGVPGLDVMDFEKPRSATTRPLIAMLIAGQDFPAYPRWYGGRISLAGMADDRIA